MSVISSDASATPIADAIVVFFVSAISTLPRGAIAARNACGSTMSRRFWRERQADGARRLGLADRHGVDPGRSDSQTNAAV